jgi:hypothetical protein
MDLPTAATEQQTDRRPKPRGTPFPPGVSGDPTGGRLTKERINARVAALIDQWSADFDGCLTAIERSLLEQAARLLVRAERIKDHDVAVRATNAAQRLLSSLQTKKRGRRGRPPIRERMMEAAGE